MALSGTINGTTNTQYVSSKMTWSAVQSVSGNYSDVTVKLYYSRTNSGYTTYGTFSGSINVGGSAQSGSAYIEITYNSNTLALSKTFRVYHNSDGTKSVTITASGGISGTSFTSTNCSGTITLDSIGRATVPNVASTANMGSSVSISLPRSSSSFTHTLWYKVGNNAEVRIASNVATSYTWSIPLSLASNIPNATSLQIYLLCQTFNGSTLIGQENVTMTLNVPSSVTPDISSVTVTEGNAEVAQSFSVFVQNRSQFAVTINASGSYGSTITAYETTIQNVPYRSRSFTSSVITASGTVPVRVVVTDSRGRTDTYTKNVTVEQYSSPTIDSFVAFRCNSSGVPTDEGTKIGVTINFSTSQTTGNVRTYTLKYKTFTGGSFTTFASGSASAQYSGTQTYTGASDPTVLADTSYVIRLEITDNLGTNTFDVALPSSFTLMDFRYTGRGMAIGKVSEKDLLEVAMNAEFISQMIAFGKACEKNGLEFALNSYFTKNVNFIAQNSGAGSVFFNLLNPDESTHATVEIGNSGQGLKINLGGSSYFNLAANGEPSFSQPVPITSGGTGAITAAQALANLGGGTANELQSDYGTISASSSASTAATFTLTAGTWLLFGSLQGASTFVQCCFNTSTTFDHTWSATNAQNSTSSNISATCFRPYTVSSNTTVRFLVYSQTSASCRYRCAAIKIN